MLVCYNRYFKLKKLLVTGSSGLIGSEVCNYFDNLGWNIYGIDNNQRKSFFGDLGDTSWNLNYMKQNLQNFNHIDCDIRDRKSLLSVVENTKPNAIVHTAAQPSHDKAAQIPFDDFDTNAVGTFNLLEAARQYCKESPFIHLSTNKVYGDSPNNIPLIELDKRYEYKDKKFENGISENFSIDQSTHSLFGASKVAADICVQEFGKYFKMPTVCLRGGCLTGPLHSGVELHGFLSYLVKCNIECKKYKIFGYKGKQVRDNIHSIDVSRFIEFFIEKPRIGEVYNIGGGKNNTCSILESFRIIEEISGKEMNYEYKDESRIGDHICYYSDLRKLKKHYPEWNISRNLHNIFEEIHKASLNNI